jgi:hypothetical protein
MLVSQSAVLVAKSPAILGVNFNWNTSSTVALAIYAASIMTNITNQPGCRKFILDICDP